MKLYEIVTLNVNRTITLRSNTNVLTYVENCARTWELFALIRGTGPRRYL